MGYIFDGPSKKIQLTTGTTTVEVGDMYSRWIDWLLTGDNSKYLPAMRNVGGEPISSTKNLGVTYFLVNGWRVVPDAADHRLTLSGNLVTDPAGFSPVDTQPGYSIIVEYSVSSLVDSTIVSVGSGLSVEEHDQLMTLPNAETIEGSVLDAQTSGHVAAGTVGKAISSAGAAGDPWGVDMITYTDDATFGAFVKKLLSLDNFMALRK